MGLLLRTLRPATDALCQVAAELRPDWARLLSSKLYGPGSRAADSGAATVFIHGDGIFARNFSAGDPAEEAGKTIESLPADSAPLYPAGQSVDVGGGIARDQSQSAERFGAPQGCAEKSWVAPVASRSEPA